jgi:hypothetical protein
MAFREAFGARLVDRISLACLCTSAAAECKIASLCIDGEAGLDERGRNERQTKAVCGVTFVSTAGPHVSCNVACRLGVGRHCDGTTKG